ncbi:MAG: hypothetical protein D6706_20545 [Chloroflexi bacterium]|nr:MAG: hypothetical protein D6706_20545 [Chloroflexota bacterium]
MGGHWGTWAAMKSEPEPATEHPSRFNSAQPRPTHPQKAGVEGSTERDQKWPKMTVDGQR